MQRRINRIQPFSLLSFLVLGIVLAWGTAAVAQNEGDKYVLDSLQMLLTARTIESDLRIETFVNGKKHTAEGIYAEQALPQATPEAFWRSMYRLEIIIKNPSPTNNSKPNRMTLVCHPSEERERNRITRYVCIEGAESFSIVDLGRVEEWRKAANQQAAFTRGSEVRGWGGLAGKMRQISRLYEFAAPTQENLQEEETVPTWKLTGTLKSIYYKELLAQFGGLSKKGLYPADFPSDIEIWLGRHNDFPYKIRYLRRASEKSSQKELLYQESFFKVNVGGAPIAATRFVPLTPPEAVPVHDETENFIHALGL